MAYKSAFIIGAVSVACALSPVGTNTVEAGTPTPALHARDLNTFDRPLARRYRYNKRGIERDIKGTDSRVLLNANHRRLDASINGTTKPQAGSIGRSLLLRSAKRAQRRSRDIGGTVTRRSMDNGNRPLRYVEQIDEIPQDCSLSSRSRRTRCEYKRKVGNRFH